MKLSAKSRALRSGIATLARYSPDDTEGIADARLALRVSKVETCLHDLLNTDPKPTPAQRAGLVRLLRTGATS